MLPTGVPLKPKAVLPIDVLAAGAGYHHVLMGSFPVCRCLELPILLLCSTDDPVTKSTWKSLGFVFTTDEDMKVRARACMHEWMSSPPFRAWLIGSRGWHSLFTTFSQ